MSMRFVLSTGLVTAPPDAVQRCLTALHDDRTLSRRMTGPGFRLSAKPTLPIITIGNDVVVLGTIFSRQRHEAVTRFETADAAAILSSDLQWLIDHCWGGWLAIRAAGQGRQAAVVRDASPAFPVYHAMAGDCDHYSDDGRRLIAVGLAAPVPDPGYARQILAWPGLRTARTGIAGITELLPAQRRRRTPSTTVIDELWSPWTFAAPARGLADAQSVVAAVREEILGCVAAWTRQYRHPVLELSGGLDSSIIAAAMSTAGIAADAMTYATRAADGDERRFARAVAERTNMSLHVIDQTPTSIDLQERPERRLRPGTHPVLVGIDAALSAQANLLGADALISGTGGDNVFCFINTAAPLLDLLRSPLPRRRILATLNDLATLHETTSWHVARSAWRRSRRPIGPSWRAAGAMIDRAVAGVPMGSHPWLDIPADSLPGKVDHVKALLRIYAVLDTNARGDQRPMIYPLLSQPVVEACLRIPTWRWIEDGRDRSVARAAFASLLPEPIIDRRTKGRLETQSLELYLANRLAIRDILLSGWLAEHQIVDRVAIERYTATAAVPRDELYYRLFDMLGIELWAASWRA